MKIGIIDIINIILIFQLVLFSFFLFVKKNNHLSNYILGIQLFSEAAGIFSCLCLIQSEYLNSSYYYLIYIGFLFITLWGPTFYLYVKSAAFSDFKFKLTHLIHFSPFVILILFLMDNLLNFPIAVTGSYRITNMLSFIFYARYVDGFVRIQVLFYIILSVKTLYSVRKKIKENYSSISKTNLSWVNFLVTGFILAYILSVPLTIFRYSQYNYNPLIEFGTIIPYFIYFNIIFFRAWYQPEIFNDVEESKKYKYSKLTNSEAESCIKKLNEFIEINMPHLNPELTLTQLADELKITPRILSQIINEYFNQSFYDFINKLRIEESKKMLLDFSSKKTVLEILYSSGFNTKSSYNRAFKKATGYTPTEYKKKFAKETISSEQD